MILKRFLAFILFAATVFAVASAAQLPEISVSAKSAVLYDPLYDRIIWSKQPDIRLPMASTTKIMTALLSLELYELDREVEIQPSWTGAEGSSMYLKAGERVTVEELVYGLMLMSGNDAAVVLSKLLTGNSDDFVALMNRRAEQLGMKNTSFENPNGLDGSEHYSTAEDMALLMAAAMENEDFCRISSTESVDMAGRHMKNHNKLLSMSSVVCGGKTGFTKKAGRCLVSVAEDNGRRLIAVTLSAPDDWNDHIRLYDIAFEALESRQLISGGQVDTIPVYGGEWKNCPLYIDDDFEMGMFEGDDGVETELYGPRVVYAPISSGDKYGYMVVSVNGKEVYRVDVRYKNDIASQAPAKESLWQKMINKIFRM